jgi:hypothetical protein
MPDSPLYNMAWRFDIFLDLDPAVFSRAVRDVVEGSDSMRAVFWVREGQAMQRDSGELPADAEVVDLSASPDPSAAADAWINRKVGISFDLSICSYRYALLKLDKGHWVWHFNQHHIACDAHATSVLFREVSDRYEALLQGKVVHGSSRDTELF